MNNKLYKNELTATVNTKGVLDIDTFKGCPEGIKACGEKGCYGVCYAAKMAKLYKLDFNKGSSRNITNTKQLPLFKLSGFGGDKRIYKIVKNHKLSWFRIGTMGDPCHNWDLTLDVCEWLCEEKTPVIVTKHWISIPGFMFDSFQKCGAVFNTSVSALDDETQINHRLEQHERLNSYGIKSVLRIVTCKFGNTKQGREWEEKQTKLTSKGYYIDNPLRISKKDERVVAGDIVVEKTKDIKSFGWLSIANKKTYIGHCEKCPDQCGVEERVTK